MRVRLLGGQGSVDVRASAIFSGRVGQPVVERGERLLLFGEDPAMRFRVSARSDFGGGCVAA